MSSGYESMLREALSGLGSYSKLANGNFRLQAPSGQTCAVYFSGNVPGNAVEIDFSAKALAPILGRTEAEIAEWVAAKAAQAGRERIVSGLRGKCPGLAVGSGGELQEFLLAWAEFTRRPVRGEVLETTRVEKAAQDAGFDLTPAREGDWMIFRSSAFPQTLGVLAEPGGGYGVGFSVAAWGRKVAHDGATDARIDAGPWLALVDPVTGYEAVYAMIQRAGRVARLLSGEGARQFAGEAQRLPATTEAERLVIQRGGQDIFRQSLIDYWQGRCAVTGLDVPPLLRASHIKPWAQCESDAERLDVFNGLLLAPHLDALFDGGWLSFDDHGRVAVSPELSGVQRVQLGVQPGWRLAELAEPHHHYLAWHRWNRLLK